MQNKGRGARSAELPKSKYISDRSPTLLMPCCDDSLHCSRVYNRHSSVRGMAILQNAKHANRCDMVRSAGVHWRSSGMYRWVRGAEASCKPLLLLSPNTLLLSPFHSHRHCIHHRHPSPVTLQNWTDTNPDMLANVMIPPFCIRQSHLAETGLLTGLTL